MILCLPKRGRLKASQEGLMKVCESRLSDRYNLVLTNISLTLSIFSSKLARIYEQIVKAMASYSDLLIYQHTLF